MENSHKHKLAPDGSQITTTIDPQIVVAKWHIY